MSQQTHLLLPHHHAHLSALGIPWLRPPYLRCDKEEYARAYKEWRKTHPHQSHEFLHTKALGHIAWAQHSREQAEKRTVSNHDREIKFLKWIVGFLVLALLLAIARPAHAQFSHLNNVQTKNQGTPLASGFHASSFSINCSTNMTCADDGTTLTLSSSGGGAATGYQTLQNAAVSIAQQTTLNWTAGITCVDNAGSSRSDCALKTVAAVSHQFFNAVTAGALVAAQPVCADLSNAGTLCTSSAALAANTTATAHNFFTAYNSTTGAFTKAQPVCGDLSDAGTLCTSSAALAATIASVAHKWLNSYTASTGAFTQTQPACGDLSDSSGGCTMSTTAGGDLSGTLPSPTVAKVNGIAYSATAAAHTVEVITTANTTATAKVIPDCTDATGNHLNYTQSTDSFSCGTTDSHVGTVTSVSGTANEITSSGGATPALSITSTFDIHGKTSTAPVKAGTIVAAPATCQASIELYVETDATAGQQLFICNATGNGWVLVGDGGGAGGGVTSVATTSPITGGTITTTGTIACATCVTSAASLTSNALMVGGGSQASAVLASLGTTTTVLHGNAAGLPTFAAVTSSDTTGTFPSTPHALLDASVDSDTTNTAPTTGLVPYANATPKWTGLAASTIAASGGVLNETQATLSAPSAPTLTGVLSGGTILHATTVYVIQTVVNPFGETVGSTETSVVTGTCSPVDQCSVTVPAATLTGNGTGSTVYWSIIQGQETKQTGCINITTTCTLTTPPGGTGAVPPFFNTASNGTAVIPTWLAGTGSGIPVAQNFGTINPLLAGGVYYVAPSCAELGACINQILMFMPTTGGRIHIPAKTSGAAYAMSTPVASNVSGKVVVIEGDPNATFITYTGPSGSTPFQLSWGTLHNIGGGMRDLEIDNGASCVTNTNTGIDMGGGGGGMGAEMGFLQNVKVFCFNNGINVPSTGNTFLMTMSHLSVSGNGGVGCTNGINIQNGENLRVDNSAIYQCTNGVNSASNVDWEMLDSSIDDNSSWGILHSGTGVVNMHNTHFENVGQGPAQYVKSTNGHVALYGGQMLEDRPVASISTTTCAANVITIVTSAANHRSANEEITITGVAGTGSGANGDFTVASITNSTTFTYNNTCSGTFTGSTGTVRQKAFVEMGGANLAMTTVTTGTISNGQVDRVVNFTAGEGELSIINAQPTLIPNEFNLSYNGSRVISCPLRADAAVATCRYFGYNIDAPQGTVNASIMQLGGGNSLSTSGNWTMQKNGNAVNGISSTAFYAGLFGTTDIIAIDTNGNEGLKGGLKLGASATGQASLNLATTGAAPISPAAGDIWIDTAEEKHVVATATSGAIKLYDSGGTNAITHTTSGTITSYTVNHPLAAATGVLTGVNSSNVITWSHSGDAAHSISQLAKTAAVTTFTLCAATANTACGQAGQYRISYNFYGSGTACATVTAGSVGLNLTWTDTNAVTHTTISLPLWDQKSAAMTNGVFNFNTALGTESASGSYIISTNGTIIQAATTYTACTSGTGTYNLKMTVEQLQ